MEDVGNIVKVISDVGISVVLSGVFVYVALQLINIGVAALRKKVGSDGKPERDEVPGKKAETDLKIQFFIESVLNETKANRVIVMELHNSITNMLQMPCFYMSLFFEAHREGLAPLGEAMKNLPTSLYSAFLANLRTAQYILMDINNKDSAMGKSAYDLLLFQNETIGVYAPIRGLNHDMIGYVSLQKDDEITQQDILLICEAAKQLNILLTAAISERKKTPER